MSATAVRLAVVTGADRPVGAAVAARLRAGGAGVVAHARQRLPEGCAGVTGDLADRALAARLADAALAEGPVDALVCADLALEPGDPADLDDERWAGRIARGATAPLVLAQRLGRGMLERGSGVIVALVAGPEADDAGAVAGGAALHGLAKVLAVEWAPRGVRVVTVTLSPDLAAGTAPAAELERVAGTVAYACSPEASFVTGAVLQLHA